MSRSSPKPYQPSYIHEETTTSHFEPRDFDALIFHATSFVENRLHMGANPCHPDMPMIGVYGGDIGWTTIVELNEGVSPNTLDANSLLHS